MTKPPVSKLFYIPQKPYLALGTFRDQIIYPDTYEGSFFARKRFFVSPFSIFIQKFIIHFFSSLTDFLRKGGTDEALLEILNIVELNYLYQRETFDGTQDWQEVLSGGERQRVSIARLIYSKAQFAILDECTSAVSIDVEQRIYKYLTEELKCTLLSVTHRVKQLQSFHSYELR